MPDRFWDLDSRPASEQENHWILESLTTDYGELRYYLFAESKVFDYKFKSFSDRTPIRHMATAFKSPWAAESIDPHLLSDSRLAIFKFNRKVLFSARAGHPNIVEEYTEYLGPPHPKKDNFLVLGRHYYYDPSTKESYDLPNTLAYDCNMDEFGLEDR